MISLFNKDGTKNENNRNYISPDGLKYVKIGKIGVIATMNDAKLSNSRISLSNNFLNFCHYLKLPNYTIHEIKLLADKIIRKNNNNLWKKDEFNRVINCFEISQKYSKKYSENGGNTFREILKLGQFIDKCGEIPLEYLLELILCTNIPTSEMENFKNESGLNIISNSLSDLKLKIENKYLCFDKFVKYKLINDKNYEIKTQFTISQKEAIMKIMIGLLAKRPILLTGDIGTGKTFIIEQLADIIGANLKVIQFNSETTSLDIIGRLELTVDQNKLEEIKNSIRQLKEKLIKIKYRKITEFIILSLVNLCKLIDSEQPLDDKKLAQIIEFSVFTSFKQEDKIEKINMFKQLLKENKEIEITPIRNIKRSHEYYLSIYEIDIISYFYNKNKENINVLNNINEEINKNLNMKLNLMKKR